MIKIHMNNLNLPDNVPGRKIADEGEEPPITDRIDI
jgi:hypothetical protein